LTREEPVRRAPHGGGTLLRAPEIYELHRLHFAESYLAACAEASGIGVVASFDRAIDRLATVQRFEPAGRAGPDPVYLRSVLDVRDRRAGSEPLR
jgi:hypothetical protein